MTARRPVVVQHSFGEVGAGGPVGALQRVLDSRLSDSYDFVPMHQGRATGSVDVARVREWVGLLREVRPDLVHVRGLGNEGFHAALAARLASCPRILVSIHGTVRDLIGPMTVRRRALVQVLEPATLHMATHVTTVCEFAAARPFVRRHAAKFVGPIVNGVDPDPEALASRTATREELGLGPRDVAVVSVGRLSNDKGHRDLAVSLGLLDPAVRASVVLVLVGDGPDRPEIDAAYRTSGVRFLPLGRRLDVPRILAAGDVFAFPSLHENLSNALLEAMAHGLPVVATRVGGNTEVVTRGGGLLVEPGRPRDVASALNELVTDADRRRALGEEAAAVVREHYSTQRMLEVLDATYRGVLGQTR